MDRAGLGVIWLLAGCNTIFGLDETVGTSVDAVATCSIGAPFTTKQAVAIDGTYSIEGARFNPPQTIAYLSLCPTTPPPPPLTVKDECELYASPYSPESDRFSAITKLPGVSFMNRYDAYPTITPDGRHILFGSSRDGGVNVFVAAANNGSFDNPTITRLPVGPNVDASNEPYVLGDGKTVLFGARDGDWDLYRTSGEPPSFGGNATLVPGVNGDADEFAPVLSDDEREIFFASDRAQPGNLRLDIYTSTRASPSDPFPTPRLVTDLSGSGIDWPLWISPDACKLYYINKVNDLATLMVARR